MKRRTFSGSLLAASAMTAMGNTLAQSWPSRPVRLVVAHPAGSGVDAIARILGDHFSRSLGMSFIVENKPGGQNVIGASSVAKSLPDGYTIYLATAVALVTNVYLFKELAYDPRKDFAPIGLVGQTAFAMVVSAQSNFSSLQDFIQKAKASPGKISMASEGPKTFSGITARLFNSKAGINTNVASYASSGVALQDVMGGHVDAFFIDVAAAAELTKQGKLRMLAMTSTKRVPGWNVPTVAEVLPGFDMVGWYALVAPAGLPKEIAARLNQELDAALKDKVVAEKIASLGTQIPGAGTPDQLNAFLSQEHSKWASVSREIGLLPE